ncbi:MAG TPA: amidohydrolase family protein [Chloroflexota bacterium]|nr:amidohydrolase family protein [Chloroflexota bacterium]
MAVVDCDAHVEESVATWSYLEPEFHAFRPIPVTFPEDTCFGTHNAAWVIDYKLRFFASNPTTMKRADAKGASIAIQELADVPSRTAAIDELGIDRQVIFPSIWLGTLAENVDLEAALARSYNTYMATQCAQSGDRLWYVAVVPWRRPDLAIKEIARVKEMPSAAGIFARGVEWDMPLTHPMLRPIFEAAAAADLPICVHVGNGSSPTISRMLDGVPRPYLDDFPHIHPLGAGLVSGPYVLYAFQQILSSDLLDAFPALRVGFMEAGCEWVPRIMQAASARNKRAKDRLGERVFVSCRLDEDLPYLTSRLGDEWIITATDYPHGDAFRQDRLAEGLLRRGDLDEPTVEKIVSHNPARLFHLGPSQ